MHTTPLTPPWLPRTVRCATLPRWTEMTGAVSERAYLKIGYFVRLIAVVNRVGLALRPRQRAIGLMTRALFLILRVADASPSGPCAKYLYHSAKPGTV